jgi:hypothetical protein
VAAKILEEEFHITAAKLTAFLKPMYIQL